MTKKPRAEIVAECRKLFERASTLRMEGNRKWQELMDFLGKNELLHEIGGALAIPTTNEITSFFHCAECIESVPPGLSPREWAELEVGFTPQGIQVWCKRHERNVLHIHFEGLKHPASMS